VRRDLLAGGVGGRGKGEGREGREEEGRTNSVFSAGGLSWDWSVRSGWWRWEREEILTPHFMYLRIEMKGLSGILLWYCGVEKERWG
jgi:hypothetical protein